MPTHLKPLEDRLIVRRIEADSMYKRRIHIPETNKDKQQIGEIISAGPGKWEGGEFIKPEVSVGQRIMFGKYSGTDIKLNEEDLTIIRETDVLAIVVEDA